jgi:beta-lactamase regulating signal transducer with metallopeptidase domain
MTWSIESVFGVSGLLVEVAWKSSVILGIAILLHLVLRKRCPLVVSFGWNAVLVGLVALPIATGISPWQVDYVSNPPLTSEADSPSVSATLPLEYVRPRVAEAVDDASLFTEFDAAVNRKATFVQEHSASSISSWHVVAAIYLCGVVLCGLRLFLSGRSLHQLLSGSLEVHESQWTSALSRWRSQLGIRRSVRIRTSSRAVVPFTTGVIRPILVLPERMPKSANQNECEVVVLHELTHVARFDCAWQYLLKLLQTIYWWQPLVWLSGRQIAEGRERVCDLFCVGTLGNRQRYADALLSIVQSISRPVDLDIGLAMARVPRIASRLDEIAAAPGLKTSRPSTPVSALLLLVTVLATTVLAAGVDVVAQPHQPASPNPQSDDDPRAAVEPAAQPDDDELQPTELEQPALAAIEKLIGKQFRLNKNGTAFEAVFGGHELTPPLLEHLSKLTNLRTLYLHRTKITDAGMENLNSLTRLRKLYLGQTDVGDAGIAHLKGLTQLEYLDLGETQVTNGGLQKLEGLTSLRILSLYKTPVTDAGLEHLRGFNKLELLTLQQAKVTDEAVRELQQALPKLVIRGKPEWAVENPEDAKQISVSIAVPARDSIRSIDIRKPGSHFNVVVTNRTNRELQLWEAWNSWGYYNLSFEVLDDEGNVQYSITKKPRSWTVNAPTWITIKPGEHLNLPVDFHPDIWAVSIAAGRDKRSLVPLLARFATSPKFELRLRAVLRIYPDAETIDRDIWTGTVRSVADIFLIHHSQALVGDD